MSDLKIIEEVEKEALRIKAALRKQKPRDKEIKARCQALMARIDLMLADIELIKSKQEVEPSK